jgi:NAD(P)-dependent dehydrogenase (short-subunit alcohol dehydrogenase family)
MRLKGKTAIVAGGGQGIGEGIVLCLAEEGADVAVVDINGDIARAAAARVSSMGRRALSLVSDLTDEKQAEKAAEEAINYFGKIDILVNNVGGVSFEMGQTITEFFNSKKELAALPQFMRLSGETWEKFFQLNLKSHVMMSQAVTPYFVKQMSGKIVNISSVSGRQGEPGNMAYASMKAGDISLTWSLARALASYNINVNCVCPGFVYTPLWERGAAAYLEVSRNTVLEARSKGEKVPQLLERFAADDFEKMTPREYWLKYISIPIIPMGREQTPEDIGRAVVFLVSEEAKNITGQVLNVDGGMVMR